MAFFIVELFRLAVRLKAMKANMDLMLLMFVVGFFMTFVLVSIFSELNP